MRGPNRFAPARAIVPGCLAALAALSIFSADAAAQQRPDFSGEWSVRDAEAAGRGGRGGPPPDKGSGGGRSITIAQSADTLIVEYEFFSRGDLQPPLKFRYALDGSITTNSVLMGRGIQERTSRVTWDGETLVITTTHTFDSPRTGRPGTVDVTRRLSLASATELRVESTIGGVLGGPPTSTATTYTRS
jgi:hypothetical protein